MNFFHCPIKIVSRNKGRSAVASAAYISGTRLENTWDGTTHDYTRKQHIIYSEIMLSTNAPAEYMDRATLWNSVEWNETDRNAQLARVFEIPMKHEGPDARAMEKRDIRTEVGDLNRDIRAQNKLLEQLEARLTKLNSYAMYEKKLDEELIAQGKDVSDPNLRFMLASQIFNAGKPENKPDHRLRDASGLLVIMKQYEITDAASYATAVKKVNTRFYELRSKRKDNYDLSIALSARITAYEERKKYQRYYKAWEKLPDQKRPAFEKQYAFELRKFREAEEALQRWQDNGETIDYKGWQKALKYLNTERMVLDIDLREIKEDVRRLEVVKREYIKKKKTRIENRYH